MKNIKTTITRSHLLVRPILIYTNAQPQDMSKKLIMTPEMFDEFLQAELLD
ncbi:hypothetical protein KC660_04500 [Candidatus Dojkabacteria bacterium]|uniref:Uncharacterized protein n=1 Tax=Candidatus Dojkabacteria bacterium TaxID=2099670 RepID=A0A955RIQ9_9BACT|nr:hypothetical protein [Candidatus Dojkabacteria bacterium]